MNNVPYDEKDKRVRLDARVAMVVANEKDAYERAFASAKSTLRGRFAIFARQFFGFPPLSDSSVKEQLRKEKLEAIAASVREEEEAQNRLAQLLRDREELNKPFLDREWPDKKTMKTQPIISSPDADSDPTRTTAKREDSPPPLDNEVDLMKAPVKKTILWSPPAPPLEPKVFDTKVRVDLIQGIIFYELPLPTSYQGRYERENLTDNIRDYQSDALCHLVENNALFVIYWYGGAPYEGAGYLVVVFDDGSVDAISLGHCSCYEPLDDLAGVKRGAYHSFANFRESLSAEAKSSDYSTILTFADGGYELPQVRAPGAQTIQQFPGFSQATKLQPPKTLTENPPAKGWTRTYGETPIPGGSLNWQIEYKETKPSKKRAKKKVKKSKSRKTTKKSAKRRGK